VQYKWEMSANSKLEPDQLIKKVGDEADLIAQILQEQKKRGDFKFQVALSFEVL
jgi:hypothetical protein